jgi:hypothetical protein
MQFPVKYKENFDVSSEGEATSSDVRDGSLFIAGGGSPKIKGLGKHIYKRE